MKFISSKTDFAFKKIFGSTESKETPNLEIIPSNLEEVTEINKALSIANKANLRGDQDICEQR